jgi:hypothetical protein
VTFVDGNTLHVVTPAHAAGSINVMTADGATGQAVVALGAFAYSAPSGGGGGGCSIAPASGTPGAKDAAASSGWIVLALAVIWMRSRRARTSSAR